MQTLIENVKLDGVTVTVEDAANYLGIAPTSVIYRVVNFTKSNYQGHLLERCEISTDKVANIAKNSDEAILHEQSNNVKNEGTEKMTIREALKETFNKITHKNKSKSKECRVIRKQDGKEFASMAEVAKFTNKPYPTVAAHLKNKGYFINKDTQDTYVLASNPKVEIKQATLTKKNREHWIIQCKETGDVLVGLPAAYLHSGGKLHAGKNFPTAIMRKQLIDNKVFIGKNGYHYIRLEANDTNTFSSLRALPKYNGRTMMSLPDKVVYKDARAVCKKFGISEATFGYNMNKHGKYVLKDKNLTFINVSKYAKQLLNNKDNFIKLSKKVTEEVKPQVQKQVETVQEKRVEQKETHRTNDNFLLLIKDVCDYVSKRIESYLETEKLK